MVFLKSKNTRLKTEKPNQKPWYQEKEEKYTQTDIKT